MPKLRITLCASRGWTVSYSCINTKSAWRSAADVKVLLTSSIFLPVRSRPPCCNTPHNIQLCRLKGVESRAPPGHRPPDTCAYESQQQCQHHHQHASYSCLTRLQNKVICLHTESLRPENILSTDCKVTLMAKMFSSTFWSQNMCCTKTSWGSQIGIMHHAMWYCLIECTKSKLDSH